MADQFVIRILRKLENQVWPRRHGELRATITYWLGLAVFALGCTILVVQLQSGIRTDSGIQIAISLTIMSAGAITTGFRWHRTLHFRRYGVSVFRFGRQTRHERYADWERVELGPIGTPLLVVRKDGTKWRLPNPDEDVSYVRGEILWQLDRAGVAIPDYTARLNRFGIGALDEYSRKKTRIGLGPPSSVPPLGIS